MAALTFLAPDTDLDALLGIDSDCFSITGRFSVLHNSTVASDDGTRGAGFSIWAQLVPGEDSGRYKTMSEPDGEWIFIRSMGVECNARAYMMALHEGRVIYNDGRSVEIEIDDGEWALIRGRD